MTDIRFGSSAEAHASLASPIFAFRHPVFPATREAVKHSPIGDAILAGRQYREAWFDFEREVYWYAWWPIAPIARAWGWWFYGKGQYIRFSLERFLGRRVIDKAKGENWTNWAAWEIRPVWAWTWNRTDYWPDCPSVNASGWECCYSARHRERRGTPHTALGDDGQWVEW